MDGMVAGMVVMADSVVAVAPVTITTDVGTNAMSSPMAFMMFVFAG